MNDDLLSVSFVFAVVFVVVVFVGTFLFLVVVGPWLRALGHGTPVSMVSIMGMRVRGNPPRLLIDACIALRREGVEATITEVENTYIDNRTRVRNSQDLVELVKSKGAGSSAPRRI